jgi:hypothetical protein
VARPAPPRPAYRSLVARFIGLLLLTAAVVKVFGLTADPVARMGVFSTPEFHLALIEFEVFLSLWLLSGKRPLGSWMLTVATFSGFATVSFYQGWIGQSSCGCFGRLTVSPWVAFAVDLFVLTVLFLARPHLSTLWEDPARTLKTGLLTLSGGVAGMALIGGALMGLAYATFGSVPGALAHFRGERVSIAPRLVDVGVGARGESLEVSVTLTNWTDKPIQLFGGTADCSCTVLDDLPLTIPANESRSVSVRVSLSGRAGIFTRRAAFMINDDGFKKLEFGLTGRIVAAAGAREKV